MRTVDDVQGELQELLGKLKPMLKRRDELTQELKRLRSLAWIAANEVTADQIHSPYDDGLPWFGIDSEFVKWVALQHPRKRFICWNGRIDFTDSAIARGFNHESPGRMSELEQRNG